MLAIVLLIGALVAGGLLVHARMATPKQALGKCFYAAQPSVNTPGQTQLQGHGSSISINGNFCQVEYQLPPVDADAGYTIASSHPVVIAVTYILSSASQSKTLVLLQSGNTFAVNSYEGVNARSSVVAIPVVLDVYYPATSANMDTAAVVAYVREGESDAVTLAATSQDFGLRVFPTLKDATQTLLAV